MKEALISFLVALLVSIAILFAFPKCFIALLAAGGALGLSELFYIGKIRFNGYKILGYPLAVAIAGLIVSQFVK